MTKISKSPRHKEAPAPAHPSRRSRRATPQDRGSAASDFGAADQRALDRAYRACRAVDGPADAAGHRGDARQPREGPGGKRRRPEMAPQWLEKIESAPGNGSVSEASNLQDLVPENEPNQRPRQM